MIQRNPFLSKAYRYNRPKKKDNLETHLRRQVIIYLRSKGHIAGKINVIGTPLKGGGFIASPDLMRGLPDIFSFAPDKTMYAWECKIGKNPQSVFQRGFENEFHLPPHRIYAVIHSIEEAEKILP